MYPLPTTLPPKGTFELDRMTQPKSLDGQLTRTQVTQVDKDFKGISQPWDRETIDASRIVEVMMFHDAAGGTKYTSLLNRLET